MSSSPLVAKIQNEFATLGTTITAVSRRTIPFFLAELSFRNSQEQIK